jgi:hypothetical protein
MQRLNNLSSLITVSDFAGWSIKRGPCFKNNSEKIVRAEPLEGRPFYCLLPATFFWPIGSGKSEGAVRIGENCRRWSAGQAGFPNLGNRKANRGIGSRLRQMSWNTGELDGGYVQYYQRQSNNTAIVQAALEDRRTHGAALKSTGNT